MKRSKEPRTVVPSARATDCPRCGYDQSGVVASWTSSCPIEGRCSECGLGFRWEEVLMDHVRPPRWSFEHAQRFSLRCLLRTSFRSVMSVYLWRGVRMTHPISRPRLWVIIALFLPLTHFGLGLICLLRTVGEKWVAGGAWVGPLGWSRPGTPLTWTDALRQGALVYPDLLGKTQLEVGQFVTSIIFLALPMLLFPLTLLLLRSTFRAMRIRREHLLRGLAMGVLTNVISVCSVFIVPVLVIATLSRFTAWRSSAEIAMVWAWLGVVFVLQVRWWSVFCSLYLRLPHALWVALLGMVISVLLAFGVVLAMSPSLATMLIP